MFINRKLDRKSLNEKSFKITKSTSFSDKMADEWDDDPVVSNIFVGKFFIFYFVKIYCRWLSKFCGFIQYDLNSQPRHQLRLRQKATTTIGMTIQLLLNPITIRVFTLYFYHFAFDKFHILWIKCFVSKNSEHLPFLTVYKSNLI